MGNDDIASQIAKAVEQHINKNFPKGVSVLTGVTDDEAVRDVQRQFQEAGFDCPDETARDIVRRARELQENQ